MDRSDDSVAPESIAALDAALEEVWQDLEGEVGDTEEESPEDQEGDTLPGLSGEEIPRSQEPSLRTASVSVPPKVEPRSSDPSPKDTLVRGGRDVAYEEIDDEAVADEELDDEAAADEEIDDGAIADDAAHGEEVADDEGEREPEQEADSDEVAPASDGDLDATREAEREDEDDDEPVAPSDRSGGRRERERPRSRRSVQPRRRAKDEVAIRAPKAAPAIAEAEAPLRNAPRPQRPPSMSRSPVVETEDRPAFGALHAVLIAVALVAGFVAGRATAPETSSTPQAKTGIVPRLGAVPHPEVPHPTSDNTTESKTQVAPAPRPAPSPSDAAPEPSDTPPTTPSTQASAIGVWPSPGGNDEPPPPPQPPEPVAQPTPPPPPPPAPGPVPPPKPDEGFVPEDI